MLKQLQTLLLAQTCQMMTVTMALVMLGPAASATPCTWQTLHGLTS